MSGTNVVAWTGMVVTLARMTCSASDSRIGTLIACRPGSEMDSNFDGSVLVWNFSGWVVSLGGSIAQAFGFARSKGRFSVRFLWYIQCFCTKL